MDEKKIKKAGIVAAAVPLLTAGTVALVSAYQSDHYFRPFDTERELQKNQIVFSDNEEAVGQQEEKQGDESEYWKKNENSQQDKSPAPGSQDGKYLFENGILEQNNQVQNTAGILENNTTGAIRNTTEETANAAGQPLYNLTGDRSQADTILHINGNRKNDGVDEKGEDKSGVSSAEGNYKKDNEPDNTNGSGNNGHGQHPSDPPKDENTQAKPPFALSAVETDGKDKTPQKLFENIDSGKYSEAEVTKPQESETERHVQFVKSFASTENALYKGQTVSQKRIFNALDTYVYLKNKNGGKMYYWLTEDLDKYVRIDAISFDGGQTWTDDFPVVIPEDIAADQMKIKAGYRFSTGDPTWEEYIVDYEIEDSRICVLSEALTRENQVLDMSKIINKESQYQQEGATFNLFYLQLSYLGEKRLRSLFPGWSENGKRIDWFYPVTPGRHILEPKDMVPLDAAYDVRLQLAWMNQEHQVDPDSGNYLCYLQTLVNVENGAVQTDKEDQTILEVPEYIQAVVMNKDAQITVDSIKIPDTVVYVQMDDVGLKVKKKYQVSANNQNYATSARGFLTNKTGTEYLGIPYEVTELSPESDVTKIHMNKENQIHTIRLNLSDAKAAPEINYENLTDCKILVPENQIEEFTKKCWNDIKKGSEIRIASIENPSRTYTVKYGSMIDQNGSMRRILLPMGSRIMIPADIKKIETDAFSGEDTVTSLLLAEDSEDITLEENCFRNSAVSQILCHTRKQYNHVTEQLKKTGMSEKIEVVFADGISREGYKYTIQESEGQQKVVLLSVPEDLKHFDGTMTDKAGNLLEVEEIAEYAFSESETLEWVSLPETVKKIGFGAFENCTALQEIMIESRDTIEIGDQAFEGCDSLRFVGSNAPEATMVNEYTPVIVDSKGNSTFYVPTDSEGYRGAIWFTPESEVVSYQMINIGERGKALYGMNAAGEPWLLLRTGTMLDSRTILPATTVEIWSQALENTTAESGSYQINWNDFGQLFIDSGAFEGSRLGGDVVFGDNCYLADYALYNCSRITSVTVGNDIGNLGSKVFEGCSNLKRVEFGTLLSGVAFESGLFDECNQLTTITMNSYWAPNLLLYGLSKYQFNYSWTAEEEVSRLHLQVPEDAEENYIQKWRYLYAGSVDAGGYPAYLNLWYQIRIDHMDWDTWEAPSDEVVDVLVEQEVLEAENRIRSLMRIGQVQEPTQYYPYHLDNEGMLTLVGASSDTVYMDLWMGMDNLPDGKLVNYIGTGAFTRAKSLSGIMFPDSIRGIYTNAFQGVESDDLMLSFISDTPPELLGWSKEEPFTFGMAEENIHIQLWEGEWKKYVQAWIFPMVGYTDLTEMRTGVTEELTVEGVDASEQAVDMEIAKRLLPVENRLRKMFDVEEIADVKDLSVELNNLPEETTDPNETEEEAPEVSEEGVEQQKQEPEASGQNDEKENAAETPESPQEKEDSDPDTGENTQEKENQKDTDTAIQTGSGEETQE